MKQESEWKASRNLTLKRGASFIAVADATGEDWKYLGAAHAMGVFNDLLDNWGEQIGDDYSSLKPEEFRALMPALMETSGEYYVLHGIGPKCPRPVGLIAGIRMGHRLEPHVLWFGWATKRNRLETILRFIQDMRAENLLIIYATPENETLFHHIGKYGVFQRENGTVIENYYGMGVNGRVWWSK